MIPYARQDITPEDVDAVVAVLRSDFLTQGPAVPAFEQAVAARCGVKHALAMSSATSALHAACLALGVGPGDLVWTSPVSFVASANCARYCGASVDFVDIDPQTFNMCPRALAEKLARAAAGNRLPKVVIVVHMAGRSCDMAAIRELTARHGVAVIEDAAHAIGGSGADAPIGACRHSDITVFSFHPVKIITTGEGGMALTQRDDLADALVLLRSHGITRDPARLEDPDAGAWYYEQQRLGFNFRMTDIQAALGHSQLARLDAYIERRHLLADRYDAALAGLPLQLPLRADAGRSALHLYVVRVDPARTDRSRREVFDGLRARGIGVNVHYIPIHLQPDYRRLGFRPGMFPAAEAYYRHCLSLPMYATLDESQQDSVVAALHAVLA